jgi:hypothetical protein
VRRFEAAFLPLHLRLMIRPSALFRLSSPDSMLTAQEVRNHLQTYVTTHTTVPRDQSIVYLDDLLKKAVLSKNEDGMIRIQKADLEKRLRGKMTEFFAIDRVGEEGVMKCVALGSRSV